MKSVTEVFAQFGQLTNLDIKKIMAVEKEYVEPLEQKVCELKDVLYKVVNYHKGMLPRDLSKQVKEVLSK